MKTPSRELLQALIVTAEVTGNTLSESAAKIMAIDLAQYPENQVLGALSKCRREITGKLTLAHILNRLDDGRPGVEEAWAIVSPTLSDERRSIFWTQEMATAFGICCTLDDDPVAARMAFKESYLAECQKARDEGRPPLWTASLGTDLRGRDSVLLQGVKQGKLTTDYAMRLLSHQGDINPEMLKLAEGTQKRIEDN